MIIYGLKTCDTCRKALKSLPEAAFHDIRRDGLPEAVLERAWQRFGEKLLNKRSTTWRGLSEAERRLEARPLIIRHPTLMKRPLIEGAAGLLLGWDAGTRAALDLP